MLSLAGDVDVREANIQTRGNALNKPPIWSGSGKLVGLIQLLAVFDIVSRISQLSI